MNQVTEAENAVTRIPPEQAVARNYQDLKAELQRMAEENAAKTFDYEDPTGNKAARSHVYRIRQLKGAIEKRRKELKADSLEYGRRVDAVAKELAGEVEAMIDVHEKPLKQIEDRETQRKQAIQDAIDRIDAEWLAIQETDSYTLDALDRAIERVKAIEIDPDTYQERMAEAAKIKGVTLEAMQARRAEVAKAVAEAAELARLREAEEERKQKEREEQIAREAEERAKREAAEREERMKREHEAAIKREREQAEAKARAEKEAREAKERAEAEAKAKREADKKHRAKIISEAESSLVDIIGPDVSGLVIAAIADGKIKHVRIYF